MLGVVDSNISGDMSNAMVHDKDRGVSGTIPPALTLNFS
jgi:hypothetical protein